MKISHKILQKKALIAVFVGSIIMAFALPFASSLRAQVISQATSSVATPVATEQSTSRSQNSQPAVATSQTSSTSNSALSEDELQRWQTKRQQIYKNFNWMLSILFDNEFFDDLQNYKLVLNQLDVCAKGDFTCLEKVSWQLDDLAFKYQGKIEEQQCRQELKSARSLLEDRLKQATEGIDLVKSSLTPQGLKQYYQFNENIKAQLQILDQFESNCQLQNVFDYKQNVMPNTLKEFLELKRLFNITA